MAIALLLISAGTIPPLLPALPALHQIVMFSLSSHHLDQPGIF